MSISLWSRRVVGAVLGLCLLFGAFAPSQFISAEESADEGGHLCYDELLESGAYTLAQVDETTGIITLKKVEGRALRALDCPVCGIGRYFGSYIYYDNKSQDGGHWIRMREGIQCDRATHYTSDWCDWIICCLNPNHR